MALELASGARETCTVSGNDFTLTGATSGAISFLTAITKTAGTVDGSTVYAYAFESADPSTYEVMEMTYNSASDKLVRVDTVHGSNGASAVTFDTATGAAVIYRTLTDADVSSKAYSNRLSIGLGNVTSNGSNATGAFVRGSSDNVTVTPYSSTTKLLVTISGDLRVDRTSGSAGLVASEARGGYVNSSSVDTAFGQVATVLMNAQYAASNVFIESPFTSTFLLDNTHYNASGDWQVFPHHRGTNGNFTSNLSNLWIRYQELNN